MKRDDKAARRTPVVDWEKRILGALEKAGSKGLARSRLSPPRKPEAEEVLAAEIRKGRILRLGSPPKSLYFLAQFAPNVGQAVEAIDRGAAQSPARLFLEKELGKFCGRGEAFFLKEAVQELVQGKILVRLTRGKTSYYVHRAGWLTPPDATRSSGPFDPKKVEKAYRELVDEQGFLDVRPAELASRSGAPLEPLKAWLLEQSRTGHAHLSRGDWSLASEEERRAAVFLGGQPHLLVRFDAQPEAESR
ncbi:hypothetical protein [Verrucomicrobium sp. 3C]|uniref:hypothetical protein n=1 Tax=Verrucomicrobium sp. 3C TaxID=1134055 RepID=UPI000374D47C|nr:hypothetical protein [Verrucomicrobium sp. 3C]